MEKCTESPPTLQVEPSFPWEDNVMVEPQMQHLAEGNTALRSQVMPTVTTPVTSASYSLEHHTESDSDSSNLSGFLAQVTTYLTPLKCPNPTDDAEVKHFCDFSSHQIQRCGIISGSDRSTLLQQYENFVLEFQKSFDEPMQQEMNPLISADADKENNSSQKDAATFQSFALNMNFNMTNQNNPLQEGLPGPIQNENSITNMMNNLPDLITQCIQLDKKYNDKPELLQSETQVSELPSLIYPKSPSRAIGLPFKEEQTQLRGGQLPLTPAKRARQQETLLCLYCSQAGHFTEDCLAKRSRSPNTDHPAHQ
ncbi:retrotransposon Gag-like protein 4 [Perognathus longimembris pacificus]|uniref:retrotransposon Gag-like protein 4 n=1 Tax=Perognathus longimembris pacificus TaxID=214514 RepID=UPI0020185430|nr:retrotransposon Gag-like protein 4 [Perognathus longimembris pacificus]